MLKYNSLFRNNDYAPSLAHQVYCKIPVYLYIKNAYSTTLSATDTPTPRAPHNGEKLNNLQSRSANHLISQYGGLVISHFNIFYSKEKKLCRWLGRSEKELDKTAKPQICVLFFIPSFVFQTIK